MPGPPALGAGLQASQLDLDPLRLFERMLAKADTACNQKLALAQMLVEVCVRLHLVPKRVSVHAHTCARTRAHTHTQWQAGVFVAVVM
eukprot:scaffold45542_cov21-Tisochrysis_lutea.AAC.4